MFISDFIKLYSYADGKERFAILLGTIVGMVSGVSHPLFIYLWCQELDLTIQDMDDLSSHLP
jgi:hypothetical protein